MMKILITAGGTSEKIDEVRKISNIATGRLGSLIAEEFKKRADADITYVCSETAVIPPCTSVRIIRIGSVGELMDTLTAIFKQNRFDAVIHTMAVSDYTVRGIVSADDLSSAITETVIKHSSSSPDILRDIVNSSIQRNAKHVMEHKKISSDIDNLMIFMSKTPKVISMIKRLQPETVLVGFKLLAGVDADVLLHTGHELLVRNNCDLVFANDLEGIQGDKHQGILIEPDCSYKRLNSKQEIAGAIAVKVLARAGVIV